MSHLGKISGAQGANQRTAVQRLYHGILPQGNVLRRQAETAAALAHQGPSGPRLPGDISGLGGILGHLRRVPGGVAGHAHHNHRQRRGSAAGQAQQILHPIAPVGIVPPSGVPLKQVRNLPGGIIFFQVGIQVIGSRIPGYKVVGLRISLQKLPQKRRAVRSRLRFLHRCGFPRLLRLHRPLGLLGNRLLRSIRLRLPGSAQQRQTTKQDHQNQPGADQIGRRVFSSAPSSGSFFAFVHLENSFPRNAGQALWPHCTHRHRQGRNGKSICPRYA